MFRSGMAAQPRHFEFIDHTADVIVRAYGPTRNDAFAAAAEALFDVITDSAAIEGRDEIAFTVESIDLEGLLVAYLSELIVLHEIENIVLSDFVVDIQGDEKLEATARSEPFDPERHGDGTPVKGISYHLMKIGVSDDGRTHFVEVLLDI